MSSRINSSRCLTLMIQGTTSDAGKSAVATGLCRALYRRGIKVAPFKPQNMALNSAVTVDGGEIGRAQAVQAQACGLEPHTDMNPVLLKPNSDTGSQIIIHGKAVTSLTAREYHAYKPTAMKAVLESHARLAEQYEVIVVEGAGSPAEINLRENDIANMGFAEAVDCPVVLVADIERGGVFAHLFGTVKLLSTSEQNRIVGTLINRFRGDPSILQPGIDWLIETTGKTHLGTLPFLHDLNLEAEDSLGRSEGQSENAKLKVIVPALPRLSNHTDFDPLKLHQEVELRYIGQGNPIPGADLIILPGTKSVRQDLNWLREQGWEEAIQRHLRYGGRVLGICGGLQMLGIHIHDPQGIEGRPGSSNGLGILEYQTTLETKKQLRRVSGQLIKERCPVQGYEIHSGTSEGADMTRPFAKVHHGADQDEDEAEDGAISDDDQVRATYLHGLFDHPDALSALLNWAGLDSPVKVNRGDESEQAIDRLADIIESHSSLVSDVLSRLSNSH